MSILLSCLLSISLHALQGDFYFQGESEVLQTQRIELVPAVSSTSQARVNELKQMGYRCERVDQFHNCRLFNPQDISEFTIAPRYNQIRFGEETGTDVIVDGDELLQYQVTQDIQLGEQSYDRALYTLMKPQGLLKISVPDARGQDHFIVRDEKTVGQLIQPRRKVNKWVQEKALVETYFTPAE